MMADGSFITDERVGYNRREELELFQVYPRNPVFEVLAQMDEVQGALSKIQGDVSSIMDALPSLAKKDDLKEFKTDIEVIKNEINWIKRISIIVIPILATILTGVLTFFYSKIYDIGGSLGAINSKLGSLDATMSTILKAILPHH